MATESVNMDVEPETWGESEGTGAEPADMMDVDPINLNMGMGSEDMGAGSEDMGALEDMDTGIGNAELVDTEPEDTPTVRRVSKKLTWENAAIFVSDLLHQSQNISLTQLMSRVWMKTKTQRRRSQPHEW